MTASFIPPRRAALQRLAATSAALALPLPAARADAAFPERPIRVIVPYAAGGADTFIRPMQPSLQRQGITMVVESVPGAGGLVGTGQVKRSAPDGYTALFCGSGALTIAPRLQPSANVSLADFTPVLNVVSIPYLIAVQAGSPYAKVADFVAEVRRNPGRLTYGSSGTGTAPHLAMEAAMIGIGGSLTHVPFGGIAPAVTALLGGHVDSVIGAPSVIMPQVRAGKLAVVAATSKAPFEPAPEIPTLASVGVPIDVVTHFGFLVPKATPAPPVARLAAAWREAAEDPAFRAALAAQQSAVEILDGPAYAAALAAESAAFDPVIAKLPQK